VARHIPVGPGPADSDRDAEQKARISSLSEALSVLLASEAEILSAVDNYSAAIDDYKTLADGYRVAGEKLKSAADGFHGALFKRRDDLITPGHLGDLDSLL
jgi:hypothetical protein